MTPQKQDQDPNQKSEQECEDLTHYSSVNRWLNRLASSTAKVQHTYFKHFMEWLSETDTKFASMNPDQLVEYQKQRDNRTKYDILDLAQLYVSEKPGTYNTKSTRYSNIRSFFLHNRAELPDDPSFNITEPEREPVKGTLTAEEIRTCILSCNPKYQAIYLCMFQSAMDQDMFMYWNQHGLEDLKEKLREDLQVLRIDLPGRKKAKNKEGYYTVIARDAINLLKNWLKIRKEEGYGPDDPIFLSQFGTSLTKSSLRHYWTRHLRDLGIIDPVSPGKRQHRTGKGLHEMRDVWRSLWSKSPADHRVGEYLMGHQIDDLGYDKSWRDVDYYRNEYIKAAPYFNIISSGEAFGRVDRTEVERLRQENRELRQKMQNQQNNFENTVNQILERLEALEREKEKGGEIE
ncbi:MAG: hypothetical protein ACLFVP_07325 [Candidatus Bathyarchaeia archaeon]